jgi:hypothetical protein
MATSYRYLYEFALENYRYISAKIIFKKLFVKLLTDFMNYF